MGRISEKYKNLRRLKNMINKIFEILLNDDTKYKINTDKLNNFEIFIDVLCVDNKLLDMKRLLSEIKVLKHALIENTVKISQSGITIKEIFDYCQKQNIANLYDIKKLIINLIINGYLEANKS